LLLTGFEPFGPYAQNPSWIAAAAAAKRLPVVVLARQLPVEHHSARRHLLDALDELNPAACLCMGLAPGNLFRLEQLARKPQQFAALPGEPEYQSTWPWETTEAHFLRRKVPHRRSTDAGQYVCESTFWTLLNYTATHNPQMPAGFLHVPAISDVWPAESVAGVVQELVEDWADVFPLSGG
jgi:pyroglutamyl-peptidase